MRLSLNNLCLQGDDAAFIYRKRRTEELYMSSRIEMSEVEMNELDALKTRLEETKCGNVTHIDRSNSTIF